MAAAIDAGLAVTEPSNSMVVDIGGGPTEVAVISLGGIAYSRSIRIGGDKMDEAIISYIRRNHNLLIGESSADERIDESSADEGIKMDTAAAAYDLGDDGPYREVRGRDLMNGVPREVLVRQMVLGQVDTILLEPARAGLCDDLTPMFATLAGPIRQARAGIQDITGRSSPRAERPGLWAENEKRLQWQWLCWCWRRRTSA